MRPGKIIWKLCTLSLLSGMSLLSGTSLLGCTQPTDTSDLEVQEEALEIEAGVIKTLYQVETTTGWRFTDHEIDAIAESLRKHIDTLPAMGEIGYQEQALEIGTFGDAFDGAPHITVTTNGAFGGAGTATNSGFGGESTSSTSFGSGAGSTYFGSPSTTNTSLNQAVGIVCSEYNNIRVDVASSNPVDCPIDMPNCEPAPTSVLSVGFGCVAAGSRPIINWAAGGSGQILTVNVSYADIQSFSTGVAPSEAWVRSRLWQAPVSGGSVVYGGPPLRRDGGLGFLFGIVEVTGGSAVFVAFVL